MIIFKNSCSLLNQEILRNKGDGMYLHIGNNEVVPMQDVVGMIDSVSTENNPDTQHFIEQIKKKGQIRYTVDDERLIKTYIILYKNKETFLVGTHIKSNTLIRRNKNKSIFQDQEIEVLEDEASDLI